MLPPTITKSHSILVAIQTLQRCDNFDITVLMQMRVTILLNRKCDFALLAHESDINLVHDLHHDFDNASSLNQ